MSAERRELWVVRLGRLPYDEALTLQRAVARARIAGALPQDLLLLVEHPPVVTLGRSARANHLLCPADVLAARGIALFEVERGGDVTYHGPGQLVGYPIVDLKRHKQDLHWYLRQVEAALIAGLRLAGLGGSCSPGRTGVWVGDRKIASIGVHARDWVTWHGFALNVTTDLSAFDVMVPCGIQGVEMTSIARELAHPTLTLDSVAELVSRGFGDVFALQPVVITPARLATLLARGADDQPGMAGAGAERPSHAAGAAQATIHA